MNVFEGELTAIIADAKTFKQISSKKEAFGCLIVHVQHRDLISAWNDAWRTYIDGYETEVNFFACLITKNIKEIK